MMSAQYVRILFMLMVFIVAGLGILQTAWPMQYQLLACVVLFFFAVWASIHLLFSPFFKALNRLQTGLVFFSENEFSICLPNSIYPALNPVIQAFNKAAGILRQQRAQHLEREFILQAIFNHVKTALLLAGPDERILYCNPSAQGLLKLGDTFGPISLKQALQLQPAIAALLTAANPSALSVCQVQSTEGEQQAWQVGRQTFQLQGMPYQLWHFEPITEAINRTELDAWKTLIRVMGHELNNSLAPVISMVQTGQMLLKKPLLTAEDVQYLKPILATTEQRCAHLTRFLLRYGEFARLPLPCKNPFPWPKLITPLQALYPFHFNANCPRPAYADEGQMGQVIINLLKNAQESGSETSKICLTITSLPDWDLITLDDAGCGIANTALSHALVPFYSTKPQGSGLGLALCKDILSAHGGTISLHNRAQGGVRVSVHLPAWVQP